MTNTYDNLDIVRRESVILADALKLAVYTIAVPHIEGVIQPLAVQQVHMTYDNTVMAAMTGPDALKFAYFITDAEINNPPLPWHRTATSGLAFYMWKPEGTDKIFFVAKKHDQVLALFRSLAEAKLFADQVKRWINP